MFDLRKLLEAGIAQVNPFDGGKNWNTVYAQKQPQQVQRPVQRQPQAQRPQPNLFDQAANFATKANNAVYGTGINVGKALAEGIAQPYDYLSKGIGETLGYNTQDAVNARQAQTNLQNQSIDLTRQAAQKLRDPSTTPDQKQRWQSFLNKQQQLNQLNFQDTTNRNNEIIQRTDPIKGAASVGSIGADVATLGIGTGGVQAAKTAARTGGRGALYRELTNQAVKSGATALPSGFLQPYIDKGNQATAQDVALSGAAAFGLGAAIPGASYGLSKASPVVASAANEARPSVIAKNQARQHPEVLGYDDQYAQLQRQFDSTLDPVARRATSMAMADNRMQRLQTMRQVEQQYLQGGYVKVPGSEPTPAKTSIGSQSPQSPLQAGVSPQTTVPVPSQTSRAMNNIGQVGQAERAQKLAPEQQSVPFDNSIPQNTSQFVKSAKRSKELSGDFKTELSQRVYTPEVNKEQLAKSAQFIQENGVDNAAADVVARLNTKTRKVEAQTVSDAIEAGKALDVVGDEKSLQKATEIYEKLAEELTKAGQTIQAASLLNNRTPQGLLYGAVKSFKKAGVEITPKMQQELGGLIDQVKKTTADTYDGQLARYKVAQFVSKNIPTKTTDKLVNFWRAGLLTAPTTTGGNILGNTVGAISKGVARPVSIASDAIMSKFTGKRTIAMPQELAYSKGAVEGISKFKQYMDTGFDERNALSKYDSKEINYGNGKAGKALNVYVNGVYRLMSAADQPFWYGARNSSLSSLAKADGLNKGLRGEALDAHINQMMKSPPTDMMEQATQEAMYATFQNKTGLGDAAVGFKHGLNKIAPGLGDFIVPFTQVPASIATRIFQSTPAGTAAELVKQVINTRKGGKFDQKAMADAIGNGAFGTAILASGYALANSDALTFGYPQDQKERDLWELQGKQPYSVKVGDRWYSLNYMQPIGTLLAIGGNAAKETKDGSDALSAISKAIATGGQAMMSQSFLKGVSGVLDAIDDPKRYAETFVENTAGSLIPNFFRSAARSIDPMQRDVKGPIEGLQAGVPGLRQGLPEKQDVFGQPLPAKDNALNQFLNPLRPSKTKGDAVTTELQRLFDSGNGVMPTNAKKDAFKDTTLTDQQVREINAAAGPKIKDEYMKLLSDPEYDKLSDEQKKKALSDVNDTVYGALKAKYGVENGLISKDKVKLDSKQRSYLAGDGVASLGEGQTYKQKYDAALSEYNDNKDTWSPIERAKKEKNLKYLTVQKDFENDTVTLYGMSKDDVYNLVSNDKDGNKFVEQILAYGDALVAAGLSKTNKFRDKYGNVSLYASGTSSSGGSKKKTGSSSRKGLTKYPTTDIANTAAKDTYSTLSRLLAGTTAKTSKPKQIGRKVALKKITVRS